jgi:hypothetical protein
MVHPAVKSGIEIEDDPLAAEFLQLTVPSCELRVFPVPLF